MPRLALNSQPSCLRLPSRCLWVILTYEGLKGKGTSDGWCHKLQTQLVYPCTLPIQLVFVGREVTHLERDPKTTVSLHSGKETAANAAAINHSSQQLPLCQANFQLIHSSSTSSSCMIKIPWTRGSLKLCSNLGPQRDGHFLHLLLPLLVPLLLTHVSCRVSGDLVVQRGSRVLERWARAVLSVCSDPILVLVPCPFS